MWASISPAYWVIRACRPAGPSDRSSSIAADEAAVFSETALRASTSAGSVAQEILCGKQNQQEQRKEAERRVHRDLQTTVEALEVALRNIWLPEADTQTGLTRFLITDM